MAKISRRLFGLFVPAVLALGSIAGVARGEFVAALGATAQSANALATFDSTNASMATVLNITGVTGALTDIDYRPANGLLYGLGSNGTLYTISTTTGVATTVSTLNVALVGTQFSIDFNPTVDRLRVVSNNGQNLRINVDTGAVTPDTGLSQNGVVGAAYTNSVAGATATTLYDLRYVAGATTGTFTLNTQSPPNDGTINFVGNTGITSPSSLNGFDISGTTGLAYIAYNTSGNTATNVALLSTIDLATGNVSSVAPIDGFGFVVRGISAAGTAVPEPASVVMLGLGLAGAGLIARRRAGSIG